VKQTARRLATLLAALILPACALVLYPAQAEAKTWPIPKIDSSLDALLHPDEYANRVMAKINKVRARHHRPKVKLYQSCLDHKANSWAVHLSVIDDLVHRNQVKVLKDCNLQWAGECLVTSTGLQPGKAVSLWMHSDEHRPILLKKRADRAGLGVAITPAGKVFVVLNFGDAG
jgi:uncharacterized protein YkwD